MKLFVLTSLIFSLLFNIANAENYLKASSLVTCMDNSQFSATNFDVIFTPNNRTISYDISANIELSGKVKAEVSILAYGFTIIQEEVDPCKLGLNQLCPFNPGQFEVASHSQLGEDLVGQIPGVAYNVPDIDAIVYVKAKDDSGKMVACIRVDLTNGKTVNHVAVKWVTAVISGIGLVTSAVVSTWGNSYTATHIATNALLLFGYFQSVVIIAMEAVDRVPPMASAWAQNIVWSMGLIEVNFMQKIFRWYVQATGGKPTTNIRYPSIPVLVQKRDQIWGYGQQIHGRVRDFIEFTGQGFSNSFDHLVKRSDTYAAKSSSNLLVLRGIKRVGYQAGIEQTSIVLTGFTFFVLICLVMGICFAVVRGIVALLVKSNAVSAERVAYYKYNWRSMFKGAILRMIYIAFPQLLVLSLWEFVQHDSAAVIVLAVFFFLVSVGILGWNSFKVFVIGQRSIANYKTPAYLLYSDSQVVNKYGFLYIQFDASKYFFVVVGLIYIFVKACFVSFAQGSGKTQGLSLFIIELAYLAIMCWKKPYMDKSTNVINIITAVIMTLNAFFFLFFSNLFGQPPAVSSIMGVLFFIINAAFSLVLLIFTLVTCTLVLFSKHPDSRYKPPSDDRASFIQEQYEGPGAAGELTALGDAAKADHQGDNSNETSTSTNLSSQEHLFEKNDNDNSNTTPRNVSFYSTNNSLGDEEEKFGNNYYQSQNADTPGSSQSETMHTPMVPATTNDHARTDSSTGLKDESTSSYNRTSRQWPL